MNTHTGNTQPAMDQEEHARIGGLDGKKTFLFDNAGNQITSFGALATVNINGAVNANVSLGASEQYIGLVTSTQVGLVTTVNVGLQTLAPSPNYIGLASVNIGGTLPALSAGAAYVGLATVDIGSSNTVKSVVSLSNSVSNIGFATVNVANTINANVSLSNSIANIGFATVRIASNVNTNIGLVTIDGGTSKSLVSLMDSVANIGFATVRIGSNVNTNIGLMTIDGGTVKSLVSLGASVQNIGFATIFQAFPGGATVYSGVISATGNTTVFVAPASNLFFLKDLHISSLGRSEVEIRSGATTIIPFTSLSTTSGFHEYYGEYGKPSRAQADALVIGLNGGATISYAATVRFGV